MTETIEAPPRPTDIDAQVQAEIKRLREAGQLEVKIEPRCRICADDSTRALINNLLARMLSERDVFMIINSSINPARKRNKQLPITQRIVTYHSRNHFAIDNPAWAIFRSIGVKREQQFGRDYENGIAQTVTHLAFLEMVLAKAHENLIQPETVVSVSEGMSAAVRLAELERKSANEQQQAEIMAEVSRIIGAVKEIVPPEMWESISAKVSGDALPSSSGSVRALAQRVQDDEPDDDDEEAFDPGVDEDFDEDDD